MKIGYVLLNKYGEYMSLPDWNQEHTFTNNINSAYVFVDNQETELVSDSDQYYKLPVLIDITIKID